ncbi:hypothetical protein [Pseudoalteromonas spongiae]|uniref:Uncharacterized protein n=1 Tax=Pseudoalteromonas spongiae TaxID=298657 RepID=A0ABU8EUC6_9GAMM
MSDSMIVFIRSSKIPSIDELRREVASEGLELESWDEESLQDIEGFWPGTIKGQEAGFEFMLDEIDDEDLEDWGVDKDQLDGRDYMVDLTFRTEMDLAASAICASFFCKTCDGLTFDDDEELTINSSNCSQWASTMLS